MTLTGSAVYGNHADVRAALPVNASLAVLTWLRRFAVADGLACARAGRLSRGITCAGCWTTGSACCAASQCVACRSLPSSFLLHADKSDSFCMHFFHRREEVCAFLEAQPFLTAPPSITIRHLLALAQRFTSLRLPRPSHSCRRLLARTSPARSSAASSSARTRAAIASRTSHMLMLADPVHRRANPLRVARVSTLPCRARRSCRCVITCVTTADT